MLVKKTVSLLLQAALFCSMAIAAPEVEIVSTSPADGVAREVELKISGYEEGVYQLVACYGFFAGEDNSTNGWANVKIIDIIKDNVDSFIVQMPDKWDDQIRHVRFMLCSVGLQYLDYVQSTDGKAEIPLGVIPAPDMVFEMKFKYTTYGGGSFIGYKPANGSDTTDWRLFRHSNDLYFDVPGGTGSGTRIHSDNVKPSSSQVYTYEFGNYYVKDITQGDDSVAPFLNGSPQSYTVGGPITLFNSTDYGILYYLKVWKDGEKSPENLIHDFVPVLKDGKAALFDLCQNAYCLNSGSSDLAYGEVVASTSADVVSVTETINSAKTLERPVAEISDISVVDSVSVSGTLNVVWLGQSAGGNAENCRFTIKYQNFLPELTGSAIVNNSVASPGNYDFTLSDLAPGGMYTAQLYADNGSGEVAVGSPFSFNTPSSIGGTVPENVGIWSRRVSSSWDGGNTAWDRDVMSVGIGSDSWARCREWGVCAAYAINYASWPVIEPEDLEVNWRGNSVCTICYVGYMWFDAGVKYKFSANNSSGHNSYVLIDPLVNGDIAREFTQDEMILKKEGEGSIEVDYVTSKTGWHAVKFVKGRLYGLQGGTPEDGFLFSSDGGANWREIVDPGDGSFLRVDPAEMLVLNSISRVGSELRGILSADQRIAGWELYVCRSSVFGGTDFASWNAEKLGEVIAEGGENRDFSIALTGDEVYFRIAAVKRDEQGNVDWNCWSKTVAIGELAVIDKSKPKLELRAVKNIGSDSAQFEVNIINCGLGDTCSLVVMMDREGENQTLVKTFSGFSLGTSEVTFEGLLPNRKYTVSIKPVAGEVEGDESESLSFVTGSQLNGTYLPGLWQAKNGVGDGVLTFGVDVMAVKPGTALDQRTRQLGPAAAFALYQNADSGSWANPFDPGSVSKWEGSDTFGYEGEVYLQRGEYKFFHHIDDGVLMILNGVELCRTTDNKEHTLVFTCPADGWYPIHIELADGEGYAGGNKSADSFRYNYNNTGWRQFIDNGDGTLFRCASHIELPTAGHALAGGGFSALLKLLPEGIVSFKVASGSTVKMYSAQWDNLVDAAVNEQALSAASVPFGNFMRIYGFDADGTEVAASEVFCLYPDEHPQLSVVSTADGRTGDLLKFTFSVVSIGAGNEANLKVNLSTSPDMADSRTIADNTLTGGGIIHVDMEPGSVVPGTVYYYQMVLTGADGRQDISPVQAVEAKGISRLSAATSASSELWNGKFSGELEYLGAGETTVYLLLGEDADSMERVSSVVLDKEGKFTFDYEFPWLNKTVNYAFLVENHSSLESWSSTTETAQHAVVDSATYYWNPAVTEGSWTDPANWVDGNLQRLDPRCVYPNSDKVTVRFSKCPADTAITVLYDGTNSVKELGSSSPVALTIKATAPGAWINGMSDYALSFPSGSDVTFDGVFFWCRRYFSPAGDTSWHFVNEGAGYSAGNETGMSNDGVVVEFKNGAYLEQRGSFYGMKAPHTTLVIDNATYYGINDVHMCRSDGATVNTILFTGSSPVMTCSNISSGLESADGGVSELVFNVPVGGFGTGTGVIRHAGDKGSYYDHPLAAHGKKAVYFRLDHASPAFRSGKTDTLLVEWPYGIDVDKVVLADSPHPAGSLYFVYGWADGHSAGLLQPEAEGERPTGIRAGFAARGLAVVMR